MLKGISPLISPELLATLSRMGHGDEIILSDAHFPADSVNSHVIRADGVGVAALLKGIMPLFELDAYVENSVFMMAPSPGDTLDPAVEKAYLAAIRETVPDFKGVHRLERFDFYDRTKKAFAVVITGETAQYGNIILKKGVTPIEK